MIRKNTLKGMTSLSLAIAISHQVTATEVQENQDHSSISIPFVSGDIAADGRLSAAEEAIPAYPFPARYLFDNPQMDEPEIRYRLAYTTTYLYVAISTTADQITYRNRGYLWGDGWRILLAKPTATGRSDQYLDIYAQPRAPLDEGVEIFLATQDNNQAYRRLSTDTKADDASIEQGTLFEATIAWNDLDPFNPLLAGEMGVNLYFAKGFETADEGPFPYGYALVRDEGIWDEELQTRAYAPVVFGKPEPGDSIQTSFKLQDRTVEQGEPFRLDVAALSTKQTLLNVTYTVTTDAGTLKGTHELDMPPGVGTDWLEIETAALPTGTHTLTVRSEGATLSRNVTILPAFDPDQIDQQIASLSREMPQGTLETLQFLKRDTQQKLASLQPYVDGSDIYGQTVRVLDDLKEASGGQDPYASKAGAYRRGFLSAIDQTYQPYSLKLPQGYDATQTYPALVFLHGSGGDEQGLLDQDRSDNRFIEVAPFGRDKYFAYAAPESQTDIVEALDAAATTFPIDRDRVIIGGFSMGGYGALRAFYENPGLYKGVAVFAGHPNLANEWLGDGHVNFLEPENLAVFKDIPVFIYHGEKDAALPYALVVELAEKLTQAGAKVTFSGSPTNGHVYQDPLTQQRYLDWLKQF